jgi:hypothetical protein
MSLLPIVHAGADLCVLGPEGELIPLRDAPDRLILEAEAKVDELRQQVTAARYAIGAVMRERYGIGTSREAGFVFKVQETTSFPVGRTKPVLDELVASRVITRADANRVLVLKAQVDLVQMRALIKRLQTFDPKAAQGLADCRSVSQPSIRDLREEAVSSEAVET